MIRGITTINRNMNILQKRLENSSANISNVNTPGYKFQDIVQSTLENHDLINYQGGSQVNQRVELGSYTFGNQIDSVYKDFNQGNLINTENISDFALVGDGFFSVRLNSGDIAYTRNGNFKISEDNKLVTMQGYPVLGVNSQGMIDDITINNNQINIREDGSIEGKDVKLNVVDFNDYNFETIGDSIFITNQNPVNLNNISVRQGFLETSNINQVDEMIKLIEISKEFEANQKLLHAADETLSKAVNDIGRV